MPPPGGRNHRFKNRGVNSTRFSPGRRAWYKGNAMEWTLHVLDQILKEEDEDKFLELKFERGANVKLVINLSILRFPIKISLTAMTPDELAAFKSFIDLAVTTAMPIVQQRQQDAEEALRAGDTSYPRLYRPVPQFFVRQGSEYRNSTRVRSGSDWPAELDFEPTVLADDFRGDGSDVPQRDPYLDSPEDYVQAANDFPVVRPLGWAPNGADGLQSPQASEDEPAPTARWTRRRTPNDRVVILDGDEGDDDAAQPDGTAHQ